MIGNRRLLLVAAFALSVIAAVSLAYSYYVEPHRLVVNRTNIRVKNAGPALDGLRMAVIGDIHGGSNGVTSERIRELVVRTNAESPDVIFLLGDFVAEYANRVDSRGRPVLRMPVSEIAENLAGLNAPLGVFAVLGNHEVWYGDEIVAGALSSVGYRVLQNEVAVIERNGSPLRILGFRDHLRLKGSWKETSADARGWLASSGEGDVIALQHSPDIMPVITGENSISPDLKLVLSAHTHGGQVWLPILGRPVVPSTFGQKYTHGHIRENNVDLFVTTGVGTSVLPIRFMVPPEVAIVTIEADE